jgi:hypothetical protein
MFSLVITIISIALVAALAVATLQYGGQQFSNGAAQMRHAQQVADAQPAQSGQGDARFDPAAAASSLLDQSQVILGAATLYANEHSGSYPTDIKDLMNGRYLDSNALPDMRVSKDTFHMATGTEGFYVWLKLDDHEVCQSIAASSARSYGPNSATRAAYDCVRQGRDMTFSFRG